MNSRRHSSKIIWSEVAQLLWVGGAEPTIVTSERNVIGLRRKPQKSVWFPEIAAA